MTTSETISQPESLDLDFDDWQGQFEFVGGPINENNNNNNNNNSNQHNKLNKNCNGHYINNGNYDDEDLNLNGFLPSNEPILIDDETFLSLHPNDFDDLISGPQSELFIENGLENSHHLVESPKKIFHFTNNNKNCFEELLKNNKENFNNNQLINKFNNNNNNNNSLNNLTIEEIINLKNLLMSEEFNQKDLKSINKMNGFTAELCDNLTEQLEILQRQVTNLADTQNTVDDRTTRTKTEHAVLQARYHMLEEQLRDVELRSEERATEEQKRHKELLQRVEREATLQNDNCQIKIKTLETEANLLRDEVQRLRLQCDKQANDLHTTEEKLQIARDNMLCAQEELIEAKASEKKCLQDKLKAEDLMVELGKEVERLRSEMGPALPTTTPETFRLEELHQELEDLRQFNKNLQEQNEELQAMVLTRGVEEGRNLLNGTSNSLAQELDEMSQLQGTVESDTLASLTQLQIAYKDREDEIQRLKHYIDSILINIVENYPQLLEVKTPKKVCKQ